MGRMRFRRRSRLTIIHFRGYRLLDGGKEVILRHRLDGDGYVRKIRVSTSDGAIGCIEHDRDAGIAQAADQRQAMGPIATDFDYGQANRGPICLKLVGLFGRSGEEHLARAVRLEHALDIERNEKFFLDDEDGLVIEHVEIR